MPLWLEPVRVVDATVMEKVPKLEWLVVGTDWTGVHG